MSGPVSCGDCGERLLDGFESERGSAGLVRFQKVTRGGAEVSMAAIGGVHGLRAGMGDFAYGFREQGATRVQDTAVGFCERGSGEVKGGERGVVQVEVAQVVCDEGALLEFFGGCGEGFAEFGELEKKGHGYNRNPD